MWCVCTGMGKADCSLEQALVRCSMNLLTLCASHTSLRAPLASASQIVLKDRMGGWRVTEVLVLGAKTSCARADLLQGVCFQQDSCPGRYIGISVSLQAGEGTGEESAIYLAALPFQA